VTTAQGKEPIGKLHVGEKVLAYNPRTHQMELQLVLHVWKHTDSNLIDLTITTVTTTVQSHKVVRQSEVVHTSSEHPFFTKEQGFVPAGKLEPGMHILRADGSFGVVTGWKAVHATRVMYNLEVAQDHTFVVGEGQWVVHNKCDPNILRRNLNRAGRTAQYGQEAHHIIPCSLENHPLVQEATRGGFDINAEYNGRPMWPKKLNANALSDIEPYHSNRPDYANLARGILDDEYQRLQRSGTLNPGNAFDSIMYIINVLNTAIDVQGYMGLLAGSACPLPGI
jgi:hypothetical protein